MWSLSSRCSSFPRRRALRSNSGCRFIWLSLSCPKGVLTERAPFSCAVSPGKHGRHLQTAFPRDFLKALLGMISFRKTPGEQDSESKSRESGEPSGGGARVGARQNCEWCRFRPLFRKSWSESPPFANAVFAKSFRSRPFARYLCGHRHAFAEKQLVLGAGKGRSGLVAQVVHAAEELAIHHERKVAAHG